MKRIGIYALFSPDAKLQPYVQTFLNALAPYFDRLTVVSNGDLNAEGQAWLEKRNIDLLFRDNVGFDIAGYREALLKTGWETLIQYDEVVLCNSTLYGPVCSFAEMFDTMSQKNVDFWGITKHYPIDSDPFHTCPYGYIPEHLQSSFHAYRKKFVQTEVFQKYWTDLPAIQTYEDAIGKHEAFFTKHFSDLGYTWQAYVETDDLKESTNYPLMCYPTELLRNRKCPVCKRRTFFQPYGYYLNTSMGAAASDLYEYLRDETDFDLNLLWEDLLAHCYQSDLAQNLHWNYTVPVKTRVQDTAADSSAVLLIHVYYPDILAQTLSKITCMPADSDVYITTDTLQKKQAIEQWLAQNEIGAHAVEVRLIDNRGRDVSGLLVGLADVLERYEIACFIHDKKSAGMKPASVGEDFARHCFENLLAGETYVQNILQLFKENERLGMLSPPIPNHANLYPILGREWTQNFKNAQKLADELHFTVPMSEDKPPIAPLGTCFWFRTAALKPLFAKQWQYSDFPPEPNGLDGTILHAVERLYPIAVQQAGYYPAFVMADSFARLYFTNMNYYLAGLNQIAYGKGLVADYQTTHDVIQKHLHLPLDSLKQTKRDSLLKMKVSLRKVLPKSMFGAVLKAKRKLMDRPGTQYDDSDIAKQDKNNKGK
ncbi:MAG: rhamnan synthesis F family protein [Ruthenibacterium sp.]